MKLNSKIQVKRTSKLFANRYKNKAVIITAFSGFFRGNNLQFAEKKLKECGSDPKNYPAWARKATPSDVDYGLKLCKFLNSIENYTLRIESPFLSFYTNDDTDLKAITSIDTNYVKYVSIPENNLEENTIYLRRINYGFRITMGKTSQSHDNFIKWCEKNDKVKLPKKSKKDLTETSSWGGYYFYVKDEKSLTMVKMFLGSDIARIDRVIQSPKEN